MPHPDTGEIVWLSPDPRAIVPLEQFHVSRSLKRTLRRVPFTVTINQAFRRVMAACAKRPQTWITRAFLDAYGALHDEGTAHSVEVWLEDKLVGGTYGLALGSIFFAESMFHEVNDASKVALYSLTRRLAERRFHLLEVQFLTPHLASLGAIEIPRTEYLRRLRHAIKGTARFADEALPAAK